LSYKAFSRDTNYFFLTGTFNTHQKRTYETEVAFMNYFNTENPSAEGSFELKEEKEFRPALRSKLDLNLALEIAKTYQF